jgi:transposase
MNRSEAAREIWRLTQEEGHSIREAAKRLSASGYTLSYATAGRMVRELKAAQETAATASPPAVVAPVVVSAPSTSQNAPERPENPYPGLSERQHIALRAIMTGCSYTEAASRAGVNRSTLQSWRHEPQFSAFQDALEQEQARAWAEHRERIDALRGHALDVVAELLTAEEPGVGTGYMALSVLDRTGLHQTKEVRHKDTGPSRNPELAPLNSADIRERLKLLRGGEG